MLFLDVDGFKQVNDLHGHAAGDKVLCEIARYLAPACREALAGRLGGDEFAIVTPAESPRGSRSTRLVLSAESAARSSLAGVGGSAGWAWTVTRRRRLASFSAPPTAGCMSTSALVRSRPLSSRVPFSGLSPPEFGKRATY